MKSASLVLLSYDVPAAHRSTAARVAHLIFGRKDASEDGPVPYIRRSDVIWIGQSVFLMSKSIATELEEKLLGLGARVSVAPISIRTTDIDALRRRTRPSRGSQTCLREGARGAPVGYSVTIENIELTTLL